MNLFTLCIDHPVLFTIFLYLGFRWYAWARPRWYAMPWWQKIPNGIGAAIFYAADVVWNIVIGTAMFAEVGTFGKGCFTFSQRVQYWVLPPNADWRHTLARGWAWVLNWIYNGHIDVPAADL